jgi:hypothetical protein
LSLKVAGAASTPATAHCWWHRWREAGKEARTSLRCLFDRSSRPHRSPRQLAPSSRSGSAPVGGRPGGGRASPTSSCIPTSAQRPSPPFSTGARLVRGAWHHCPAAHDRKRLRLCQESLARRAPRRSRHQPPDDRALSAAHERKGGALPPGDGAWTTSRPKTYASRSGATAPSSTDCFRHKRARGGGPKARACSCRPRAGPARQRAAPRARVESGPVFARVDLPGSPLAWPRVIAAAYQRSASGDAHAVLPAAFHGHQGGVGALEQLPSRRSLVTRRYPDREGYRPDPVN